MATSNPGAKQANGVLAVPAAQVSGNAVKTQPAKSADKLKVVVRRLAPGLTEEEFTTILGDEWKVGQGKVDWFSYGPGKDSKKYRYSTFMCWHLLICFLAPQSHLVPLAHTSTSRPKRIC
jgi:hypothetical protein